MADQQQVWLVTHGEYSDRYVVCACPDLETAKAVAGASDNDYDSEPIPIVTELPEARDVLELTSYLSPAGLIVPIKKLAFPPTEPDHEVIRRDTTRVYRWETNQPWREDSWTSAEPYYCPVAVRVHYTKDNWLARGEQNEFLQVTVGGWDHDRVHKTFSEVMAQTAHEAAILIAKGQESDKSYVRVR